MGVMDVQVNFRGSTGFGKSFLHAGDAEWGVGAMQNDLTDSVEWAVQQGIADPKKVAIFGGSYGIPRLDSPHLPHPNPSFVPAYILPCVLLPSPFCSCDSLLQSSVRPCMHACMHSFDQLVPDRWS